jgi:hypothetical protein
MKITFHEVKRGHGPKYGARKYGEVASESTPGVKYQWAKVRERNRDRYVYRCTCGDYLFRGNTNCKHIKAAKAKEASLQGASHDKKK